MGRPSQRQRSFELLDTVIDFVDGIVPAGIRNGEPDILRRARLLVLMSIVMFLVNSIYLIYAAATATHDDPLIAAILLAGLIYLAAPLVLQHTQSLLRSGWLLMLGIVGLVGFSAYYSGGFRSPSLPWSVSVPLLATFVVGPVLGAVCAAMLVANTLVLYYLDQSGAVVPEATTQDELSLTVMSITTSLGFVALLAWLFEAERQRNLRRLYLSERRFRRLAEHSADAVFVHDEAGQIIDANERASQSFGYDMPTLLKMRLTDLDTGPSRLPVLKTMSAQSVMSVESTFRRGDGGTVPVDIRISMFEVDGARLYFSSARDVTSRRFADEALRHAKEEAERANKAKSQFLSNMSHEMRTPLNSIIGFARVLDRGTFGELSSRQSEFAQNILDAGEHMLGLVNDLLDFRRMEEGHLTMELSEVDLHPCLDEAMLLVRSEVDSNRHALEIDLPAGCPPAMVDRRALVRILTNLLSNAAKYTAPGGHIRVWASTTDEMVRVSVTDDGIGIAPADHERIFNYFEQVRPGADDTQGSGIGLALTRQLVHRLGGRIGVESEVGKGSTFWFTVPRADIIERHRPSSRGSI